jgi:diadenosine tetraphosphate (Ap4A) HIT family hydrolase
LNNNDCFVCKRISRIKEGIHPYFVAELKTGYVVIGDYQIFRGYTLFLCKEHKTELHFLNESFKLDFLIEMSKVAEAVYNAFKPDKLNYELLGNGQGGAHMHWHIFPRRENEAIQQGPVWYLDRDLMYSEKAKPTEAELKDMKIKLFNELQKVTTIIK